MVAGGPGPNVGGAASGGIGASSGGFGALSAASGILAVTGALTGAIGAFFQAQSQQYELESQALSLDFQQSIANLNARAAEFDAQQILEAGQRLIGQRGLQRGQERGTRRAQVAAAGIQAGVGSAAEAQVSRELAFQIDALTIDANAVRAANARRQQAVDFRNRGLLAGVSARNLRGTAGSISPALAAGTSLLGGATSVASEFVANRRLELLLGRRGGA